MYFPTNYTNKLLNTLHKQITKYTRTLANRATNIQVIDQGSGRSATPVFCKVELLFLLKESRDCEEGDTQQGKNMKIL